MAWVRAESAPGGPGMGVRFDPLTATERHGLGRILEQVARGRLPGAGGAR